MKMGLHIVLFSVVLATVVVGGTSYSALPRYNHLHHLKQPSPVTLPEPAAQDPTLSADGVMSGYNVTRLMALHEDYKREGQRELLLEPERDDIVFQLFTRKTGLSYERLEWYKPETILSSSFDASRPTVGIIHGYLENADIAPWMKAMRDWFLEKENANVILVNWAKLSVVANYYAAARNARTVGNELGNLLGVMKVKHGMSADSVYLIGFSLGAHVAGVAGQNCPGIGRITGLDPAGPEFEGKEINQRLDPTDAKFVDVIHTNYGPIVALHFGYKDSLGHVDHYVNGGSIQPGCVPITEDAISKFFAGDLRDFHPCNHERSYLYYINSLQSRQPAASFQCSSYAKFKTGTCLRNHANIFGLGVKKNMPGVYYLATQPEAPYLSRHLEVTVTVGTMQTPLTGHLDLMAFVLDRLTILQSVVRYHTFKSGEKLSTMIVLPQHLPMSAIPTQLRFTRSGFHPFSALKSLSVAQLQVAEAEQDFRSLQVCNATLLSTLWTTVDLSTEKCGQQALFYSAQS